eukprot:TRINITY_DN7867_c0_g1_i1.p2 TRINITY_DN7867_c0_g1~~TRINITY_DN7867_c0_g1_i1.p2  ORF type:complete len:361 (+),score=89.39 TRINITY_DN7867_c0_g1_i1:88-1083(+)
MQQAFALIALLGAASGQLLSEQYVAQNARALWAGFRRAHRPEAYASTAEEQMRYATFVSNMVRAAGLQRRSLNATFGVGPLADRTAAEFKAMRGFGPLRSTPRAAQRNATGGAAAPPPRPPTDIDWRQQGAVTAVKNQAQCGDCWSFSATGAIEGAWCLAGRALAPLSEQELTSCDKIDSGCNGGLMDRAFQWLLDNREGSIATEDSYPYVSGDGTNPPCKSTGTTGATITGYSAVVATEHDIYNLLQNGPVAIAVDATDWQSYTGGVLECTHNTQIDHGVLAVGTGTDAAGNYWVVKNSWTASWGESGYARVRYGVGACLIGSYGVQPEV